MRSGHLLAAFAALLIFSPVCAEQPFFRFDQALGPDSVGLRVIERYDDSRAFRPRIDDLGKPFVGNPARPLQVLVWYPARRGSGRPIALGDYTALAGKEVSFDTPDNAAISDAQSGLEGQLGEPMRSRLDAAPADGRFPVVIYAPSFSSFAWENADFSEYLASHGYIVISCPSMGAHSRDMTPDISGAEAQSQDISFLIGLAQSLPDADISKVAVGGFSWGGLASVIAAAHDSRIKALFSLDGSMRYYPGLLGQAGDVHPDQMTLPLIAFTQRAETLEGLAEDQAKETPAERAQREAPNPFNAWTHGDMLLMQMLGMIHSEFGSIVLRKKELFWDRAAAVVGDYGPEETSESYGWMARYTLEFLNAYLKQEAAAKAFLRNSPRDNGVPKYLMRGEFRQAAGLASTMEGYRSALGSRGFDHAGEVYAEMRKANPEFTLGEDSLDEWGWRLIGAGHPEEGLAVLKMMASLYPESDTYDNLGKAYRQTGRKELAIEAYRTSLSINADNDYAKRMLKELGAD